MMGMPGIDGSPSVTGASEDHHRSAHSPTASPCTDHLLWAKSTQKRYRSSARLGMAAPAPIAEVPVRDKRSGTTSPNFKARRGLEPTQLFRGVGCVRLSSPGGARCHAPWRAGRCFKGTVQLEEPRASS